MNNLPIGLWWFQDTLWIVSAPPAYKEMIGSRLLSINGHAVHEVKRKVDELISGNQQWKKYMSLYFLRSPQAMNGLSLTSEGASLILKVVNLDGREKTYEVKADFVPQKTTLEVWKDLSPVTTQKDSLIHLLAITPIRLPLYLQQVDKDYSYQYLEKDQVLYLQFNQARLVLLFRVLVCLFNNCSHQLIHIVIGLPENRSLFFSIHK